MSNGPSGLEPGDRDLPGAPPTGSGPVIGSDLHALPSMRRLAELAERLLDVPEAVVRLSPQVTSGSAAATGAPSSADGWWLQAVHDRAPVRVEDTAATPRVSAPECTGGREVRAALAVPLITTGHVIGALCVVDVVPRRWSDDEVALLEQLASLEASFEDERLLWQLAVDAAGVGAFDWNLLTGELRWDQRLLDLFGLERETFGGTIEAFNDAVHPDDLDRVARALEDSVQSCGDFAAEYRVVRPDGGVRWVSARGRVLAGADGEAVRLLGAASDTTVATDSQAQVTRVLEAMPAAFFHLDDEWRFTFANTEAQKLLGAVSTDLEGAVIWELFPAAIGTAFELGYRRAVATGEPVTFEAHYPPPLDDWYEVRAWPTPDGLSVYFLRVTDRHEAQEAARLAHERAALLASVTEALTGTLDAEVAVARLAQLVVPALGDWCVVTLVEGGEHPSGDWRRRLRDIGWWHRDPARRDLVEEYAETRLAALTDTSFVARAVRSGLPVLVPGDATESIQGVLAAGRAHDLTAELGPGAAVVVPVLGRDRTNGLLTVFRDRGHGPFRPEDLATLEDAARRAGLALDNARMYGEQRDLATVLQRSMLTAPPEPDHLHVVVRYVPATEAAQVGGDWYDAFLQPDGATVVVIGDVVGHDTEAAAAMGQLRSVLRGVAVTTGAGPAELLGRVDQAVAVLGLDTIATVVAARLEQTPDERAAGLTRLRWSNAGHPPPIVVRHAVPGQPGSVAEVLDGGEPDLLIGLDPATVRTESVRTLPRESTVLLYTDGLVERRGRPLDEGVAALVAVLTDLVDRGVSPDDLADRVIERMLPEAPEDDVALVVVRLHHEDRPRPAEAGPERLPRGLRP